MDVCIVQLLRAAHDEQRVVSLESFDALRIQTADALHGIGRSPGPLANAVELTQGGSRQA